MFIPVPQSIEREITDANACNHVRRREASEATAARTTMLPGRSQTVKLSITYSTFVAAAILTMSGCATRPVSPSDMPANLRPAAGQVLFLEAFASGSQVYECNSKAGQPDTFEWIFSAPEAVLMNQAGHPIGKHFGGPTWKSNDGSLVVGRVKANAPSPDASAIPWLLLEARSTVGIGQYSRTTSIVRAKTVGGVAPSTPCAAAMARQLVHVPYTATYYFYESAT